MLSSKCYALIYGARGSYEEINICSDIQGVWTEVMRLECQNKYFPIEQKPRLMRALLYTYANKIVYDEILLSQSFVYCISA